MQYQKRALLNKNQLSLKILDEMIVIIMVFHIQVILTIIFQIEIIIIKIFLVTRVLNIILFTTILFKTIQTLDGLVL